MQDLAARIWWNQAAGPERTVPELPVIRRTPAAGVTLALGIIGIFFTPCAIAAWLVGNSQLRAIERRQLRDHGRGWIVLGKTLGVFVTMLAATFAIVLAAGAFA